MAELDLDTDLRTLADTPRIAADPAAVAYLEKYIVFDGQLGDVPVLTLHGMGDGLVTVDNEQAYRKVVEDARQERFLEQLFVHRGGHVAFTEAEMIAAVQALVQRIDNGKWSGLDPAHLNDQALALGPTYNVLSGTPADPQFTNFEPPEFLRPYDARPKTGPGRS